MKTSLFEIRATVQKAAVGAGFATGLAEDVGRAAEWLCARGYDGVGAALAGIRSGMAAPGEITVKIPNIAIKDAAVATCGPSVIDLFAAEPELREAVLLGADAPELMRGFAGVLAAAYGISVDVELLGDKLVIRRGAGLERPSNSGGFETKDSVWTELQKLAARTYVPETDASRLGGAGAGMTDND